MESQEDGPATRLVKEIDGDSVKFLAAGEKINDIETAIRELVENSIDAGATNIEVRLSKFGVDAIEVDDNGSGIEEQSFEHLGSRYHTSKIKDFKNLQESLETYGFRGEALSCLCNIAQVTITTKTKTSPTGWKLIFTDGALLKQERMGRDKGTTVIIRNLFHSMPVRRRELECNSKKQYDKIVKLLYEQILARPHIKFSLCKKNLAKKDKDFTHGGTTLEGCLITMFGVKILDSLIPIRQAGLIPSTSSESMAEPPTKREELAQATRGQQQQVGVGSDTPTQDGPAVSTRSAALTRGDDSTSLEQTSNHDLSSVAMCEFSQSIAPSRDQLFYKRSRVSRFSRERPEYIIYGYISQPGKGKNSTDCQYMYVNKKPCDIPKLSRCINEIYKSHSQNNQYPFYCLFIQVQRWATDFNVPRKRGVILQDESKLLDIVKESLEEMYSSYAPASQKSCPAAQIPTATISFPSKDHSDGQSSSARKDNERVDGQAAAEKMPPPDPPVDPSKPPSPKAIQRDRPDNSMSHIGSPVHPNNNLVTLCSDVADSIPDLFETAPKRARTNGPSSSTVNTPPRCGATSSNAEQMPGFRNGLDLLVEEITASSLANGHDSATASTSDVSANNMRQYAENQQPPTTPSSGNQRLKLTSPAKEPQPPVEIVSRFEQLVLSSNDELKVKIEYAEDLAASLEQDRTQRSIPTDKKEFSFAIHPKFNAPAEEELKFHLNKTSFTDMQVIGQFNRGFIIARLNKHLFIIDQHATDERANFEEQLERSPLVKQAMVHPKPLYLSLNQENAILNNMDAFIKRGLEFVADPSKTVGYRVMLSATSICRGADRDEHLGKEDVEELADVASESPQRLETYTLSKVKNVSASVACRKSVMIGDALTWQQMERIVARMSGLKNPWVCAHDRPTIRHLMDVDWMDK